MAVDSFKIFAADNLGSVRAVYNEVGNSLWFVAKDVCSCLGIKNSRQACKDFMPDEKAAVILNDTSSDGRKQTREYTIVSEAGLYLLLMRSRKPEAVAFQRWITKELLPAFRKHELFQYQLDGETVCAPDITLEDQWELFEYNAMSEMDPLQRAMNHEWNEFVEEIANEMRSMESSMR